MKQLRELRVVKKFAKNDVIIITEQKNMLLLTGVLMPFMWTDWEEDPQYNPQTPSTYYLPVCHTPLTEVQDLFAVMKQHHDQVDAYLEQNADVLNNKDVCDLRLEDYNKALSDEEVEEAHFQAVITPQGFKLFLEEYIGDNGYQMFDSLFRQKVKPEQTVLELPCYHCSYGDLKITIELNKPFAEIEIQKDFEYKILSAVWEQKHGAEVQTFPIAQEALDAINPSITHESELSQMIFRCCLFLPTEKNSALLEDLPF